TGLTLSILNTRWQRWFRICRLSQKVKVMFWLIEQNQRQKINVARRPSVMTASIKQVFMSTWVIEWNGWKFGSVLAVFAWGIVFRMIFVESDWIAMLVSAFLLGFTLRRE
ncbi:hypothetical protein, partial [Klebsiella pneumoniae]